MTSRSTGQALAQHVSSCSIPAAGSRWPVDGEQVSAVNTPVLRIGFRMWLFAPRRDDPHQAASPRARQLASSVTSGLLARLRGPAGPRPRSFRKNSTCTSGSPTAAGASGARPVTPRAQTPEDAQQVSRFT